MKYLTNACWLLLAIVVISQLFHAFAPSNDIIIEPLQPSYGLIGTCVDISDFITDVESVNGIDCCCIMLNGEIIYFK